MSYCKTLGSSINFELKIIGGMNHGTETFFTIKLYNMWLSFNFNKTLESSI